MTTLIGRLRDHGRAAMSKTGTRRKSRELALQMLFQLDMGKQDLEQVRTTFWSERKDLDEKVRGFPTMLFRVACERREEIDQLIERNAEHWRMDRMAAVDRNLLRSGVAEFLGFPADAAPGRHQRSAGNRPPLFHARVGAVHQRRARQRGPRTAGREEASRASTAVTRRARGKSEGAG